MLQPPCNNHPVTITMLPPPSYNHHVTTTMLQLPCYNPHVKTTRLPSPWYNCNHIVTTNMFQPQNIDCMKLFVMLPGTFQNQETLYILQCPSHLTYFCTYFHNCADISLSRCSSQPIGRNAQIQFHIKHCFVDWWQNCILDCFVCLGLLKPNYIWFAL